VRQDIHEIHKVLRHQSARRQHKRRRNTEERLASALGKASERTDRSAIHHHNTLQHVRGLFQ
jgi:hypothetical protein